MFTRQRCARMFAGSAVALAAAGFGIAPAGAAMIEPNTSSVDDQFIEYIDEQGIEYGSEKEAIEFAKSVCQALDDGATPVELRDEILDDSELTKQDAEAIVVGSVTYYCPEFLPEEESENAPDEDPGDINNDVDPDEDLEDLEIDRPRGGL